MSKRIVGRALAAASRSFSNVSREELEVKLQQVNQAVDRKDYRAVLGVSRDASKKEVEDAYRDSMQKFHPDKYKLNQDKLLAPIATEITKHINEAYKSQNPRTGDNVEIRDVHKMWEEEMTKGWQERHKAYDRELNQIKMERERKYSDLIKKIQRNDPSITNLDQEFEKIYDDKDSLVKDFFTPEKVEILAQALEKNTFVKKLNLSLFSVGNKGVRALAKMVKLNNSLEELEIDCVWDRLDNESISSLGDALKVNTSLKTFHFLYSERSPSLIIDSLKQNQSIKKAIIGSNSDLNFGRDAPETLGSLAALIKQNTTLEELDLVRFSIVRAKTDPDSTNIAEAWQKNKSLKKFVLRGTTSRSKEELDALIIPLGNSTSVTHLTIAGHEYQRLGLIRAFGDDGAFTIAKLIKTNNSLKSIDIERCQDITSVGLQAIAEALEGNHTLTEMKVKANCHPYGIRDDTLVPKSALELEKRIADLVERNCNSANQPRPSPSSADISQAGFQARGR